MLEIIRPFIFEISVVGGDIQQIWSGPSCLQKGVEKVSVFEIIQRERAGLSVESVLRVHGSVVILGLAVDVPGVSSGVREIFFFKKSGRGLYLGEDGLVIAETLG